MMPLQSLNHQNRQIITVSLTGTDPHGFDCHCDQYPRPSQGRVGAEFSAIDIHFPSKVEIELWYHKRLRSMENGACCSSARICLNQLINTPGFIADNLRHLRPQCVGHGVAIIAEHG
jgi:hypothetical protein